MAIYNFNGDCRAILKGLADESARVCVTSPPYWGLRDYGHDGQIGAEPTPDLYVDALVGVFREVRRILKPDGSLWLNLGDGYARNGGSVGIGPNAKVANTKKQIQRRNCKVPPVWGLKDRDMLGLPWRVAFALQADGWFLRSHITWIKKTPMPESVRNRPTNATESVFLLTKSKSYLYNNDAVREPSGANLRNAWVIGRDRSANGHPAAFPAELARRCVLLGSNPADLVIDPFGGSGTVAAVAEENGRNAVNIEINPEYCK